MGDDRHKIALEAVDLNFASIVAEHGNRARNLALRGHHRGKAHRQRLQTPVKLNAGTAQFLLLKKPEKHLLVSLGDGLAHQISNITAQDLVHRQLQDPAYRRIGDA